MRRWMLIVLGWCFLLLGLVLLTGFILVQGINDAEWSRINETGKVSSPNLIVWSKWQPNEGLVRPFLHFQEVLSEPGILEFRKGQGTGMLFDFTCYEVRKTNGDNVKTVPAMGPGWGATYRPIWAYLSLAVGTIILLWIFFEPVIRE